MGAKPATTFAVGFRIDSRMYAASARTVLPFASWTVEPKTPFRSGPRAPESARWHVMHARSVNSFSPVCASVPPARR